MATINRAATPQVLPAQATALQPQTALASPYDGTNPALGATPVVGSPIAGVAAAPAPLLTGLGTSGRSPQVNATNQTALAPNGNVNQTVTNSNQYSNRFYNIILPTGGGMWGGLGGYGMLGGTPVGSGLGTWNTPGNSFVDPQTGVLYVQREQGFTGWLKRLFRGY